MEPTVFVEDSLTKAEKLSNIINSGFSGPPFNLLLQTIKEKLCIATSDHAEDDEIENFSKLVKFEMENAVKLSIPLKVDSNWGASWYEAH